MTAVVAITLLAGMVSACSPAPSTPPGMFSMYLTEPENPLVPGNTTESEGNKVITALWTPLVTFDDRTKAVTYDGVAESVTSPDNVHWTIKLKPGWTFHDGTPVTAQTYVRAWNYTALSTNAQGASYFFSNIDGYDDLQAPDEGGTPAAQEMRGLRAADPTTIDVTLTEPFAIFPLTLGYSAFDPLPDAFYRDPKAFGAKPIGNGPFMADTAWVPGRGMTVKRYANYAGAKAKSQGVVFRVYTEITTAYTDVLAGNLDIEKDLPPDAYASAKDIFDGRYLEQARPTSPRWRSRPTIPATPIPVCARACRWPSIARRSPGRSSSTHAYRPIRTPHRWSSGIARARAVRHAPTIPMRPSACCARRTSTSPSRSTSGSTPAPGTTCG